MRGRNVFHYAIEVGQHNLLHASLDVDDSRDEERWNAMVYETFCDERKGIRKCLLDTWCNTDTEALLAIIESLLHEASSTMTLVSRVVRYAEEQKRGQR